MNTKNLFLDESPTTRPHSALSVSHARDGFSLFVSCRLVSSHYHVRDLLFRGFPHCLAELLFVNSFPLGISDLRLQPSFPDCPVPAACSSGF
jgi:hypothetical protein